MTQRLISIFYVLIAAHEWEEMKFPRGFVETVIKITGMPVKDMVIPKFCLFLITVYMLLIPFCIPRIHWLVIGPLVLGIIEPITHLAVAKTNSKGKFYSPGMITALLFMIPIDVYTIYYLAIQETFPLTYWLIAALLLIVPLIIVQRFIVVHLMKMNYK